MSNEEIKNRLNQLDAEDFIWCIYLGIIILSYYSNSIEREYFFTNNKKSRESYRKIIIIIFSVLVVVYLYFLKSSIEDLRNLKPDATLEHKQLVFLSFLGSLLIAISGAIFLYIAIRDENIDVELAFN